MPPGVNMSIYSTCHLCDTVYGVDIPDLGNAVGCADQICYIYAAKRKKQMAGTNFKIHSDTIIYVLKKYIQKTSTVLLH